MAKLRSAGAARGAAKQATGEFAPQTPRPQNRNLQPRPPWQPGQSGNPSGRPLGSRARFGEAFCADMLELWQAEGKNALARLLREDPGEFVKACVAILPKDVNLDIDANMRVQMVIPTSHLTNEEWEAIYCDPDPRAAAEAKAESDMLERKARAQAIIALRKADDDSGGSVN